MVHEDNNPLNPLKPGKWDEIANNYPVLNQLKNRNIDTEIYTFDPLLDSSNISHENWRKMAEVIAENYDQFNGFVILHGTDTMCYTASALSFMLEHLSKPVILTGSQLPLALPRSDALENLVTSLSIAAGVDVNNGSAVPLVPEVCIFFRGKLLRGNRSRKLSSSAYSGFESPNYPALGNVGEHITLDSRLIRSPQKQEFFANTSLVSNIMVLDIFPGLDPDLIRWAVEQGPDEKRVKALVLKTYGAGNAPETKSFLDAIGGLVQRGVLVVNITQCPQGTVEIGLYESSAHLLDIGVISGLDMTPEAALCKLMWLFGMGWDIEQVKKQMQLDQRGEQSHNIFNIDYGPGEAAPLFSAQQLIPGEVEFHNLERAILRLQGARLQNPAAERTELNLGIYLNYNLRPHIGSTITEGHFDTNAIQYAGACQKKLVNSDEAASLSLDITSAVKQLFAKGRPGKIAAVTNGSDKICWEKLNLALYVRV